MEVRGVVVRGDGYGRKLGYPTANILLEDPITGVFAGEVTYKEAIYLAALFATEKRPILEAHLLDFEGDLYDEEIEVRIGEKIRDSKEFASEDELKQAIAEDVQKVRDHYTVH